MQSHRVCVPITELYTTPTTVKGEGFVMYVLYHDRRQAKKLQ